MSSAYYLTRLLETEPGVQISGTRSITVDGRTACHLARRMELPPSYVFGVLEGTPVKTALGIVGWCLAIPERRERMRALANWSRKQGRPVSDELYWGSVALLREGMEHERRALEVVA